MHSVIEIKPHRGGWQCFESPGVAPFWIGADANRMAIDYATERMKSRHGEIRILNAAGNVEHTLQF